MIRGALLALLLSPLGCTVNALPGSTSTRLGTGDGGVVDFGGSGDHGDGCGSGGNVDLAGGYVDFGYDGGNDFGYDAGPYDAGPFDAGPFDAGHTVDFAH